MGRQTLGGGPKDVSLLFEGRSKKMKSVALILSALFLAACHNSSSSGPSPKEFTDGDGTIVTVLDSSKANAISVNSPGDMPSEVAMQGQIISIGDAQDAVAAGATVCYISNAFDGLRTGDSYSFDEGEQPFQVDGNPEIGSLFVSDFSARSMQRADRGIYVACMKKSRVADFDDAKAALDGILELSVP